MRIALFALTCLLYWNTALSQQKLLKATQQETSAPDKGKLAGKLKDWKVFKFENLTEAMPANAAELVLQLDKSSIILKGQQRALTDGVSKVVELGPGYRREHPFPKLSYFNGKGIRMTMGKDFILGEYTEKGKKFIVEQLGNFIPGADKKQVVVYAATDVIGDLPAGCGADAAFHKAHNPQTENAFLPNSRTNQSLASCRVVDVAVMANSTSYAEHGSSVEETAAYIASIYNLSEGDYTSAFSQDFSFKINELVVSTSVLTDPWQHTDDIYKNLENFWFFAANEFRSPHDLSSYWFKTNNFAGGVIGLAYLGFTCNTVGDAAIREFKGSAQTMRCLLSHEIGHNFNMSHDAAGSPFIMAPSISGSKQFSDASKTSFETFVSSGSAACITDCNFDACERTLISGLQVTYDKTADKLNAGWSKLTGSNGYSIRWWERGSGLSNTTLVDSNTLSFSIPLNCNNTLLYRVEVANICSNGQAGTYTGVEIANSNIPQISLDGPDIICAGATTLLRSSVDNGNQWYRDGIEITGATGKTLSVSEGGSYTVRVRRDAGCSFTSNELFIIQNTSVGRPKLSTNGNTTFCDGSSVTLTSTSANSYQWLLDGVEITGEKERSIVAKKSGNYSVRVENEALCIVLSDTILVTANPKPGVAVITANRLPQLCPGDLITLSSSAVSGNQWYKNNVLVPGANGKSFQTSEAGTYTVRVTNDVQCSSESAEYIVSISIPPAKPVVTAEGPLAFCAGNAVTLRSDATEGNQWLLDGAVINGANGVTYKAEKAGRYTVQVTNAAGCSIASDQVTVNINALPAIPTVSTSGSTKLCAGSKITLTSSASTGNQWLKDGVAVAGATGKSIEVGDVGKYSVQVSNASGCSVQSPITEITTSALPAKPVITAGGPVTFCAGNSVVLTSNAATGNRWMLDGALINGANGNTYKVDKAGRYSVQVTNAAGCSNISDPVTVTINTLPAVPIVTASGSTQLCAGNKITLTSSAATGNQWLKDGALVSGATGRSIEVGEAGKYSVRVSNASGCTVLSSITDITITALPAKPVITAGGPLTFCAGNNVILTSNAAAGNQWLKDGAVVTNATGNTLQVTQTGVYSVRVTNANGCVSETSGSITVAVSGSPAKPIISAGGPSTFCAGNNVMLTSNAAAGNQWLLDGVLISGATGNTYKAEKAGKYTVQVTNTAGCSNVSDQVTVTIHALPAAPTVTASGSTNLCAGSKIMLTSSAASGNQWLKDGVTVSGATGNTLEVGDAGKYSVRVSNASGCSVQSPITEITVSALPAKPMITAGGPVTFCSGNTVVLTSDAATGNQWLKDRAVVNNATGKTLQVTQSGVYTVRVTNANGCLSETSGSITVTVNSNPAKPPISWNGTEFSTLAGFPGYKWFKDGVEIAGAAANVYKPMAAGNYKTSVIDVNACTSISDEYPLVITGVDDLRIAGASIKTYPNPARESLFVQVDRAGLMKIQARLFDMQGRMMLEKILAEGRNFISTGNLPSGLYILQLSHGKEQTFTKIVVTK